jgi:hypothetical protein
MSALESIIAHGNRSLDIERIKSGAGWSDSWITCADGFKLSVIAGGGTYCSPPDTDRGPFHRVEVMIDGPTPEGWDDAGGSVHGFVEVEKVRELIASHGGEA